MEKITYLGYIMFSNGLCFPHFKKGPLLEKLVYNFFQPTGSIHPIEPTSSIYPIETCFENWKGRVVNIVNPNFPARIKKEGLELLLPPGSIVDLTSSYHYIIGYPNKHKHIQGEGPNITLDPSLIVDFTIYGLTRDKPTDPLLELVKNNNFFYNDPENNFKIIVSCRLNINYYPKVIFLGDGRNTIKNICYY